MTIPNWAWAAIGMLVGTIIAGMTLAPGMAALNDGLTCLVAECSDLAAQRSMAIAAWVMAGLTLLATVVGGLSLALIFWTLIAAQRSATAAEQAVSVSREIGQQQMRAYVTITGIALHVQGNLFPEAVVTLVNSGQSPAQKVSLSITAAFTSDDQTTKFVLNDYVSDLPAQLPTVVKISIPTSYFDTTFPRGISVSMHGTASYSDVFRVAHSVRFGFLLPTRVIGDGTIELIRRSRRPRT